jgi:anti-sigma factor RsiW
VDCRETRTWLHGFLDGELDLARAVEIERHLEECADCSQALENHRALHDSIHAAGLKYDCPEPLQADIRATLRREAGMQPARPKIDRRWLAVAASLLLVGVSWFVVQSRMDRSQVDHVAQDVVASHVRSLLADHLTDVASSDQHTVKPWFAGKLDFAPTVADYSSAGFPLAGGRVDYLDHRPVAALAYHRRQHAINLFIWPTAHSTASAPQSMTIHGYQIVHWTAADTAYWAISDLNSSELGQFVQLIRDTERGRQ